ncbi:SWIM zinc finger family protein [Armatimonas sp.]|uniref:SWIM zinc finger family protein n=1 Tax=Armatimonas sp. TaxID=1872638 RepID=UPI00374D6132
MNLDEARQLANVNERAQRLFEDGYRIRSLDGNLHLIRKQHGAAYTLDRAEGSCTCPFFTKHGGRYSCKHVLGLKKLLVAQRFHLATLSARWEAEEQAATIEQVMQSASRVLHQRLEVHLCLS